MIVNETDLFKVKFLYDTAVRSTPGGAATSEKCLKNYTYSIQVVTCDSNFNTWGYLKSGSGWVCLSGNVKVV